MENAIRLKLGRKIKELRKKCNYAQEKLSEIADIDYKYIQRIEGKKPRNSSVVEELWQDALFGAAKRASRR